MNKYLHDNIDDFFSGYLKNYAEEPEKNIWNEIDKKLFQKEKKVLSKLAILNAVAVIAILLFVPLFIKDLSVHNHQFAEKNYVTKKINEYKNEQNQLSAIELTPKNDILKVKNDDNQVKQKNIMSHMFPQNDFPISENFSFYNSIKSNTEIKQQLNGLNALKFFKDSVQEDGSLSKSKYAQINVKFFKKHGFSINPFFSIDHNSGRFIEQYEFDNESEKDYAQRENPDISFTAGIFGEYDLNQKFSLLSGLSVSSAALSISSTAVNALKDNNGVYKFKLATSYGLAEISNSGFTPAAGDSLIVKRASLQFKYLSLPVLLNYNLHNKKIKWSVHGGIAINKVMSDKVQADYITQNNNSEIETINKIEGMRKIFFTVNTGISAGYSVSSKVDVSLTPELRYGINSINKGTPVKTYPINYGVGLNLKIKL